MLAQHGKKFKKKLEKGKKKSPVINKRDYYQISNYVKQIKLPSSALAPSDPFRKKLKKKKKEAE